MKKKRTHKQYQPSETINYTLDRLLRSTRRTRAAIAHAAGMSAAQLSGIVHCHSPATQAQALALAALLGVPVETITGETR